MNVELLGDAWIELNDIGIGVTKDQYALLDAYLTSSIEMLAARAAYLTSMHRSADAHLELVRSRIDPRALVAVTEIAQEMHNASL